MDYGANLLTSHGHTATLARCNMEGAGLFKCNPENHVFLQCQIEIMQYAITSIIWNIKIKELYWFSLSSKETTNDYLSSPASQKGARLMQSNQTPALSGQPLFPWGNIPDRKHISVLQWILVTGGVPLLLRSRTTIIFSSNGLGYWENNIKC